MSEPRRLQNRGRADHAAKLMAATLVLFSLVLYVGLFSHVAKHSLQHARHQATTHASPLCTWLCTAGEISEAVDVDLTTSLAMARVPEPWSPQETVLTWSVEPSSRAPPPSSPSPRT